MLISKYKYGKLLTKINNLLETSKRIENKHRKHDVINWKANFSLAKKYDLTWEQTSDFELPNRTSFRWATLTLSNEIVHL